MGQTIDRWPLNRWEMPCLQFCFIRVRISARKYSFVNLKMHTLGF